MPSLRQVARLAGVSTSTASRVLRGASHAPGVRLSTSRRVRDAAERLGYRVNYHMRAAVTGRAYAIGFITEVVLDAQTGAADGNLYFDALRRGVEFSSQESGCTLISVGPRDGQSALRRGTQYLLERRLDAIVVAGGASANRSLDAHDARPDLPIVVINASPTIHRPHVCFNFDAAMRMIVDHLKSLGHKEVLWYGPEDSPRVHPDSRQRIFIEVAWQAGIGGSVCTAHWDRPDGRHWPRMRHGRAALAELLDRPSRRWTAIVAYNDLWGVSACAALREAGLDVPRDVSVVGFDNLIAELCSPPLTTVDHQLYEMGRRAGDLAVRLVEMDPLARRDLLDYHEWVEPALLVRQSTTAAPR